VVLVLDDYHVIEPVELHEPMAFVQGRDDTSGFIASFAGDDRFVVDYLATTFLADVPRARLAEPGRVDELHRRAAACYETSGDRPAAIAPALAGHDVERAARLIEAAW
jgi:ATP/maltotriose-dependent transcriptional regulator MalT